LLPLDPLGGEPVAFVSPKNLQILLKELMLSSQRAGHPTTPFEKDPPA